jgi:hypothetical protein
MQQTVERSSLTQIFPELNNQIEQLLLLLSQREKNVIESRFALGRPERATLEEIGHKFNVTRERVRQIEKNALQKLRRNIGAFKVCSINDMALEMLKEAGGLLKEDVLLSKILQQTNEDAAFKILFILSLDKRFDRRSNTIAYFPFFKLAEVDDNMIDQIASRTIHALKERNEVMGIAEIKKLHKSFQGTEYLSDASYISLFSIYKQFKVIDNGIGLITWKHIHPKTLRDKIFFILRESKKALHFIDISNQIIERKFDNKSVNLQAVHNELIRNDDFILIGRGIYALKEWGFTSGTVADVISEVLKGKSSLSEEVIIAEVLKRRKVKTITIILNLKNKSQFERVGRRQYKLK